MEMKLSEDYKNRIKEAIRRTQRDSKFVSIEDQTHEDLLKTNLENLFKDETVYGSKYFRPGSIFSPDIYIKGLCVGEVKHRRKPNLSSYNWKQIEKYVENFKLPGFFVLFERDEEKEPEVRWYYYDKVREMAVKEDRSEVEYVKSDTVYFNEDSSDSEDEVDPRSLHHVNRWSTRHTSQPTTSNERFNLGMEMILSEDNKNRIRESIKRTQRYSKFALFQTHEDLLKTNLENLFKDETVYGSEYFPPGSIFSPDIYIKGLCVGEVKHRRKNNLNSFNWNQIKKYVEHFKVPGFFVLFDRDEEKEPEVRWFYYDKIREIAVKEDSSEVEYVKSDTVYFNEDSSDSEDEVDLRSLHHANRWQTRHTSQSTTSSDGFNLGGVAAAAVVVGVGALIASLFSSNRNRRE